MLTRPHRQESFCRAYVQLVAAHTGVSFSPAGDDYGVDAVLRAIEKRDKSHRDAGVVLDLQLKATTRASLDETGVTYDLEVKNYDDLRDPDVQCPRILVLLVMPEDEKDWLSQTEQGITLHRCAYWISLKGREAARGRKTVRITIPRENVFSPASLQAIFERLRAGGDP